ncbi:conserved protein [Tepidicaulis marinus]|jgi:hypothetical protein|uniref:Conserved protein n=1 Tax=Tepidicaulis marinus TaxID=1333998 RepID=A0A081BBY0_9HYPH|nr:hypothetical protein [Tepidicaulis marinus]GAK45548.1 conserved protein [Tepidicaulis marinus]
MTLCRKVAVLVLASAGIALAGCTSAPPPASPVDITYQHRTPITLNVAAIDVVDRSGSGSGANRLEQLHRQNPASLARRWAEERLRAGGTGGQATLIIDEASVREERLEVTAGFTDLFKDEVDTRLHAVLAARLEYQLPGQGSGAVDVKVEARRDVLESASLNERDIAYFQLMERVASELDNRLTPDVESTFAPIILR